MNKTYDVIISGCGPSGSLLGYLLAQNNIDTLVIEKEFFPREKICAGGIQHRALKLLPFDISSAVERSITGIYFSLRNRDIFLKKYESPVIYTVQRPFFDGLLAAFASKKGCRIIFGEKVESFETSDNHVTVFTRKDKNQKKKYFSKVLVGADGARGTVHSKILDGSRIRKILGYETELTLCDGPGTFDLKDSIRLDFGGVKKGYCWVFPKKNKLSMGMGAPFNRPKKMKDYFKSFLADFLMDYYNEKGYAVEKRISGVKIRAHTIPVRGKNTPFCSFRIIAVGDAACLGDGFTGEGLYNVFKSSIIASDCIHGALMKSDYRFTDYRKRVNEEIYSDIRASLVFTKIFYGSLGIFYRIMKGDNSFFASCCKILRGEKTYKDVINRLKSFRFGDFG
ncbi:MAG: geranylgeranyl reductase family protein [Actinobacteria bacterium]|nr:geranylgeranyl reductase family protein [Actinomycetota bacterium]